MSFNWENLTGKTGFYWGFGSCYEWPLEELVKAMDSPSDNCTRVHTYSLIGSPE